MTIEEQILWLEEYLNDFGGNLKNAENKAMHRRFSAILETLRTVRDNLTSPTSANVMVTMSMDDYRNYMTDKERIYSTTKDNNHG